MNFSALNKKSFFLVVLFMGIAVSQTSIWSQVSLIDVEAEQTHDTKPISIVLTFEIEEGKYIQSSSPANPYLIPTDLEIDQCLGMEIATVQYLTEGGTIVIDELTEEEVYQGTLRIRITGSRTKGNISVAGRLKYQACSHMQCFFPKDQSFAFSIAPSNDLATIAEFGK